MGSPISDNSILYTIKQLLDVEDLDQFDLKLVSLINSAFGVLWQLGVGPETGYQITGYDNVWEEFSSDYLIANMTKDYIHLSVKLEFDPPQSSFVKDILEKRKAELESRLNMFN